MKKNSIWRKLTSLALCLALVLSCAPTALFSPAEALAADAANKTADPSTMDRWKDFFGPDVFSSEFAGGVWTDKSVFTGSGAFPNVAMKHDDTFLVALSALSATMQIQGQSSTPSDTMLVLDLSNSMDNSQSVPDMVEAADAAIKTLLEDNIYSRVGVVLYSGNQSGNGYGASSATVILPLDRYTSTSGSYLTYTGSSSNTTVTVARGVKNSDGDTMSGSKQTTGATYIQSGLFSAWLEFEAVTDVKVAAPGTSMDNVQRKPIIVLMSDGAPTAATSNYFGTTSYNWWTDTYTSSIGTSNYGNGTANSATNTTTFLTQLTAAWVKGSMKAKYGTDPLFYTLGLGTASDSNATGVLLPSGSNATITDWWNQYLALSDGQELDIRNAPEVTRKSVVEQMNYVDQYWYASNSAELIEKFEAITGEIQLQSAAFSTLVTESGSDLSGYVSFEDEIGELMEIRHVKGIQLNGTLYTGIELAKAFMDGTFGSVDNPSTMGTELITTMCERIGIDSSTSQQLAQHSYAAKQLYYDASTGYYSNYIGWYSDVNGDYLGFWCEDYGYGMESAPAGAVYINKSYGFLGEHKSSDMMHVVVNTRMEIATSHQDVLFKVPAGMLPQVIYQVQLDGETLASGGTMTREGAEPIRLLYEVGLRSDINEINIDQKVAEYLAENDSHHVHKHDDGSYEFFTNSWGNGSGSTNPTYNTALLPYVTESHFSPATDNSRYYYTEDAPIYVKSGNDYILYNGSTLPTGQGYYRARTIITAQENGGAISQQVKYLPVSTNVLNSSYVSYNAGGYWQVNAGTAFRETSRFEVLKGGDANNDGKADGNYTGTLEYADHPMTVYTGSGEDYNIYAVLGNNGRLTVTPAQGIRVSKTVAQVSGDAAAPTEFTFEITIHTAVEEAALRLTDADGNAWDGDYTFSVSGGKTLITLSLAHGEEVVITGLPTGANYTVEELQSVYYNTEYENDLVEGTVIGNTITHVPFVNAPRSLEELTITKTVNHPFTTRPEALAGKIFTMKVTLAKEAAGHVFHLSDGTELVADENGSFLVQMRAESTVTIVDILDDTPYTVEEINLPQGFAFNAATSSGMTGTVPGAAHVVNEYMPTPPEENTGVSVQVNKALNGDYAGPETFRFRLEMLDPQNAEAGADGYVLVEELEVAYPAVTSVRYDMSRLVESFDTIGSHTFRIMEVAGSTTGMTYSARRATFRVDVVDPDMDGRLTIDVVALTNTTVNETIENGLETHTVVSEFENVYAVSSTHVDVSLLKNLVNNTGVDVDITDFRFGLFANPNDTTPVNGFTAYAGPTGYATIRIPVTNVNQHGAVYYLKEIVPASTTAGMTYSPAIYKVTLSVSSHQGTDSAYLSATATVVPYSGGGTVTDGFAQFVNTYDLGSASATILGDKDLIRGYDRTQMAVTEGLYTFQLWTANSDYTAGRLLQTKRNGADGAIAFDALDFTAVGAYYYIVREVPGNNSTITYDTHDVYVIVVVTEDGQGGLTTQVFYRKSNETTATQLAKFTNVYNVTGSDSVVITGQKVLNVLQGNTQLSGGEFTFQLTDESGNVLQTVTNLPNGVFTFQELIFTADQVGNTYNYTVSEVKGNNPGMTYDDTQYQVCVTVKDNGDGTITAELAQRTDNGIRFTNQYFAKETTAEFSGSKVLSGRQDPLSAGEFTFELYKTDANFANRAFLKEVTHDANGNFSFDTETYTATGYYYYVLKERIPTGNDRPAGMHYDAGEYHLTVQVVDHGQGQLIVYKTVYRPGSSSTAITFSNEYIPEPVDVTLTATKTYDKALTGGEFSFQLAEDDIVIQTVTNGAGGTVTFDALTFENEGTYTYTVSEVNGGKAYIGYDSTAYTVTITVTDDGSGKLSATTVITGAEEMVFDNEYKFLSDAYLDLVGSKSLTGRTMKAGEFTFVVMEGDKEVARGTNDSNGVITFSRIHYTSADIGTHTYVISEVKGNAGGIGYDETTYTIQVAVADNGQGGLTVTRVGSSADVVLTFRNTYTVTGSADLTLEANKILNGRDLEAGQFTFVLEDRNGNVLDTKTNGADGKVIFDTITYTAADIGVHHYEVGEVNGNAGGITYDQTVYYVAVTVTDNGEGGVNVSYSVGGVEKGTMTFTNTYGITGDVVVPISGSKELTGNRAQPNDREFAFLLLDSNKEEIDRAKNNADGAFSFASQTFHTAGIYTYYVVELDEGKAGFTYDDTEFEVVITVEDNGEGGLRAIKTVNGKENAPIIFVNKYEITKDTEITLTALKELTGRALVAGEFTFHVHEGNQTVATGTNDANGLITFEAIRYTAADIGTHTYVIHERVDDKGGVSFDTNRYTVTVTVADDGQGGLTATASDLSGVIFRNTYVASGETQVTLDGTKELTGKNLTAGMFSFQLTDESGAVLQTVTNDANGKFAFAPITYTAAGVHQYTIAEVPGSLGGISYDPTTYAVTVTVYDNGQGGFSSTVTGGDAVLFKNLYTVSGNTQTTISGTKVLTGDRTSVKTGEFTFRLQQGDTVLQTVTNDANGKFTFAPITYTAAQVGKTYTYTVVEVNSSKAGFTYDETVFTVTVTVVDTGSGTIRAERTIVDANAIVFENAYTITGTADLDLEAHKTITGNRDTLNPGEFTFVITEGQTEVSRGTNNSQGYVQFATITYDKDDIGTHTYKVSEVQGNAGGIVYDETTYEVIVTVSDNGQGGLDVSYTIDGQAQKEITFGNSYNITGNGELNLTGTKTLTGDRTAQVAGEFIFAIMDGQKEIARGTNDEAGNITFDTISYTAADIGTHNYTVVELAGSNAGMDYDETVYELVVVVADDHQGGLTVTHTINGSAEKAIAFANTYTVTEGGSMDISGVKVLTGRPLELGEFSFTLMKGNDTVETVKNIAGGAINFTTLQFTPADIGQHIYTVYEVDDGKGGVDYDDTVYTVVITVADNGNGGITVTKTVDGSADKSIIFRNGYAPDGEEAITIAGVKELKGDRTQIKEGEFSFVLTDSTGAEVEKVFANTDGSFAFTALTFNEGHIAGSPYTYTVSEVKGDTQGMVYSEVIYTVKITVADNLLGGITVTKTVDDEAGKVITFENTYTITGTGEATISGTKELTGRDIENGEFSFSLSKDGQVIQTVSNVGKNFTFDQLTYTKEDIGNHTYVVTEVKGDNPAITYSEASFTVLVSVADNGQGGLTVTQSVDGEANKQIIFRNSYQFLEGAQLDLTGTKNLTGDRTAQVAGEFSFVVMEGSTQVSRATNAADGSIVFEPIRYTHLDIGEHTYVISEAKGNNNGMTYDETAYTVKVTVSDNKRGGLTVTRTEDPTIVFNNKYEITKPGELILTGGKNLIGDRTVQAEGEFTFHVTEGQTVVSSGKNLADGTIVFETIRYTKEDIGEHTYTVYELKGVNEGMTYDTASYTVTVTVADDGNGGLTVTRIVDPAIIFNNKYEITKPGSLELTGTKTLLGRDMTEGEFRFSVMEGETQVSTGKNLADGTVVFEAIQYTKEDIGEHTYTVSEVHDGLKGITYDQTAYTVTVVVSDDNNGGLTVTKTVNPDITFRNIYTPDKTLELQVVKAATTTGTTQPSLKGFSFLLLDSQTREQIAKVTSDNQGLANFGITYSLEDVGSTYSYIISEVKGNTAGWTYDETEYAVTVAITMNTDGTLNTAITVDEQAVEAVSVTFTNHYEPPVTPPTGDSDIAFLAGILALVSMMGMAVMVVTRKRKAA